MANGPLLTEIRVPLVMTTDASRAVRGMQQAKAQLSKIGDGLKGWGANQLSGLGGMLSGYLGIQGALSGIRMLMDEAERLRGISTKWSPTAAVAKAKTDVATMQSERIIASELAPMAVAAEEKKTAQAAIAASPVGIKSEQKILEIESSLFGLLDSLKHSAIGWAHLVSGDVGGFMDEQALSNLSGERAGLSAWSIPMGAGTFSPGRELANRGRAIEADAMARLNASNEQIARNTGGTR